MNWRTTLFFSCSGRCLGIDFILMWRTAVTALQAAFLCSVNSDDTETCRLSTGCQTFTGSWYMLISLWPLFDDRPQICRTCLMLYIFRAVVYYILILLYRVCRTPVFASANRRYRFVALPPPTYTILWLSSPVRKASCAAFWWSAADMPNMFNVIYIPRSCLLHTDLFETSAQNSVFLSLIYVPAADCSQLQGAIVLHRHKQRMV
jgi:hypothetical protein